ncbi:MAG: anaerobic ribonucleoside-triphosphate reductase activating protein [Bacteroidales bacterium]|nr:anaerobic ribonucleoside-triphosphate reductase activating protein [Bacteroidales bacterium]
MLKFVNTDVVFQEIPDEVTLAINLSGCPCRCPGCHSAYLWGDVGTPLTTTELDRMIAYHHDITCVALMGGDAEPKQVELLARYIHDRHKGIKAAWYSGRTVLSNAVDSRNFDYIKIGPYLAHLGSLRSKRTNQRLYRVNQGKMQDITNRFWRS